MVVGYILENVCQFGLDVFHWNEDGKDRRCCSIEKRFSCHDEQHNVVKITGARHICGVGMAWAGMGVRARVGTSAWSMLNQLSMEVRLG